MPSQPRPDEDYLRQFRARVVQDALAQAEATQWRRRAQAFDDAAPRPGDWPGQATLEDLAAAARRCTAQALACRIKAVMLDPGGFWDEV